MHRIVHLLERSLKTLELRVSRQSSNAAIIAKRLDESEQVKRVYYPGLENHPGFEIAARQMQGFGGMLSFELADDIDPVSYIRRLELVNLCDQPRWCGNHHLPTGCDLTPESI